MIYKSGISVTMKKKRAFSKTVPIPHLFKQHTRQILRSETSTNHPPSDQGCLLPVFQHSVSCTVDVSRRWFPTFLLEPSHTHLSEPKINSWAETLALCSDAASLSVCGPGPSVIRGDKTRWHRCRVVGRLHAFMNPLRRRWSNRQKRKHFVGR